MNRIYKVIWSKVKNQYVVVSELAHSNGKQSSKTEKHSMSRSLRAMLAALVVAGGMFTFTPHIVYATEERAPIEPVGTGMTEESTNDNITIVIDGPMVEKDDGLVFSEESMNAVNINYDGIYQDIIKGESINFSVTGGTNGENKQIKITTLGKFKGLIKDDRGYVILKNPQGETIYGNVETGELYDKNDNIILGDNGIAPGWSYDKLDTFRPEADVEYKHNFLDVGSDVIGNIASLGKLEDNGDGSLTLTKPGEKPEEIKFTNKGPLSDIAINGEYYTVATATAGKDDHNVDDDTVIITQGDDKFRVTTTTYFNNNEKHIATNVGNTAEMPNADYSVDADGKVTLTEVDGNGNPTGNSVVISDVASKTDLGNISDLNKNIAYDSTGDGNVSLTDAVNNVDNKVGSLDYKHDDGSDLNYVTAGDSVTGAIGDLDAAIGDLSGQITQAEKNHTVVTQGNGIVVTDKGQKDEQGNIAKHEYEVSLSNDITLGTIDKDGNVTDSGSLTISDISGNTITINKNDPITGKGDGLVSGLSNTDWDWTKYENNEYRGSTNAATESQLHGALEGTIQYDKVTDIEGNVTIDKTNITLNKGGDSVTIHNVAPGKVEQGSTDAVNGGQLYEVQQDVINNSNAINNMGNRVNSLSNRIDKVGAGAAALAALHPLDFDPDDKLSFAAGYGNYGGENAVAIGAFYQPNEDTLFSVGGTVGNDENMVNVGVSFKLGQKNHVSNNRVAMAKEIISLRDKMAQLEALLAHQGVLPQGQIDTSRLFPDVPENHWAYEYVHELAKLGIVEGYPDGNFEGDRMMTRYEFAAITYRAMQKGVNVDRRMLTEFEPELKLIRVDVVARDDDGNPTIERVRVNEDSQQA